MEFLRRRLCPLREDSFARTVFDFVLFGIVVGGEWAMGVASRDISPWDSSDIARGYGQQDIRARPCRRASVAIFDSVPAVGVCVKCLPSNGTDSFPRPGRAGWCRR